ncbi:MAG: PorP/SprF family type IX secretion system membrane protein [Bacteroidia bacterium]|nr:PorP/SprF family type IX secretion system membrane protein [Bacteroidia bacterium]
MKRESKATTTIFLRQNQIGLPQDSGLKSIVCFAFILLMTTSLQLKGQDPEFSQFYANPLYLNPAFTGTSAYQRVVANYRNQWPKQGNTYVTYNFTYDRFVSSIRSGIGIKVMYDRELNGVVNSINTSFLYSYHIKASDRLFFTMALEAGFIYKQFNTSGLIFPGMIDQGTGTITGTYPLPFEDGQKIFPDFSFGVAGQMDDVYFGAALHHLTQPDQSIIEGDQVGRLPLKLTLHAGAKGQKFHRMLFSREFTLSPNLVYQQQGGFRQINAGMYMKESLLTFGVWYRNNLSVRPDAVIAMIGIQKEKFQFGYSFDFSLSNVAAYSFGSHEISLVFFFGEYHRSIFNNEMVIPQM